MRLLLSGEDMKKKKVVKKWKPKLCVDATFDGSNWYRLKEVRVTKKLKYFEIDNFMAPLKYRVSLQ